MIRKDLSLASGLVACLLFAGALAAAVSLYTKAAQAADACPLDGTAAGCQASPEPQTGQGGNTAVTYEVTPNVVLGAKSDWRQGSGTGWDDRFATDRTQGEASVTGKWGWGDWQLSQGALAGYSTERGNYPISSRANTGSEITYFNTGPELRRKIDAGDGNSVEPFAFFKRNIGLNSTAPAASAVQDTAGGGITLTKPDSYSVSATATSNFSDNFIETVAPTPENVTGRVSVSVPLR